MAICRAIGAWRFLPAGTREAVLAMLQTKTQTLALQAFLLERGACYQSLSLEGLCEMFGLPAERVRAEVNRLLLEELVSAYWNEDATMLLFVETLPSRVETLTLQMAEKVGELEDANRKMKEEKRDDWHKGRKPFNILSQRTAGGKQRSAKQQLQQQQQQQQQQLQQQP